MEQLIEQIGKIMAVVVPIFCGLVWLARRNDKSNARVMHKINKIDKHKVSYKVCDQRRAECPCKTKRKGRK